METRELKKFTWQWSLPNCLTLIRLGLIPFLVYFLAVEKPLVTLGLFFFGGLTDLLDGWFARRFNQRTMLGAALDPMADKLTIMAIFLTLIFLSIIPTWLAVLVLTRDVCILIAIITMLRAKKRIPWRSIPIGKVTTVFQNATILAAILNHYVNFSLSFLKGLVAMTVILTVASFVAYFKIWHSIYFKKESSHGLAH